MDNSSQKSKLKGLLQLLACLLGIWVFIWHVSPIIEENIPAFARYKRIALENDINPSALYYNDVHVTVDAAQNTRDTWLFLQSREKKSKEENQD